MSTNDPAPFGSQNDDHVNPFAAPQAVDQPGDFEPTRIGELTLNPWLSIWTKPRATIRQIVDSNPKHMVVGLVALGGAINGAGQNMASAGLVEAPVFVGMMVGGLIFGAAFGVLFWLIGSWLGKIAAGWLGGKATLIEMRAAYAWAQVPGIEASPLLLVSGVLMATGGAAGDLSPVSAIILMVVGFTQIVIGVWALVILCKMVGEVNLFSAWRGFATLILAGLIIVVPLVALGAVIAVIAAAT